METKPVHCTSAAVELSVYKILPKCNDIIYINYDILQALRLPSFAFLMVFYFFVTLLFCVY